MNSFSNLSNPMDTIFSKVSNMHYSSLEEFSRNRETNYLSVNYLLVLLWEFDSDIIKDSPELLELFKDKFIEDKEEIVTYRGIIYPKDSDNKFSYKVYSDTGLISASYDKEVAIGFCNRKSDDYTGVLLKCKSSRWFSLNDAGLYDEAEIIMESPTYELVSIIE